MTKTQMNSNIVITLIIIALAYYLGHLFGIGNQKPIYGESGLPVNCRALIASNVDGFRSGIYSAEEALKSIDRNCGRFGYNWHIR